MNFSEEQIKRQQLIMKHLGFYSGKIDGIWSRSCIRAKRAYEFSPKFVPAYPNRGLPLDQTGKLPRGIIADPENRNLITHVDFDSDLIAKLLGEKITKVENVSVEKQTTETQTELMPKRVPEDQHRKKKHNR